MGSAGDQFDAETTALAAVALHAVGDFATAKRCVRYLATLKTGGGNVLGTRANALALRALDRLGIEGAPAGSLAAAAGVTTKLDPVVVEFFPGNNGEPVTSFVGGARNRPLAIERPVALAPGSVVSLALDVKSLASLEFGMGLRYRVATPRSSADAPYVLRTSLPNVIGGDLSTGLQVEIEETGKKVQGQVLLQVALPGGCEVGSRSGSNKTTLAEVLQGLGGSKSFEVRDGSVLLYFEQPPKSGTFSIPIRVRAPGNFVAPPSVIYPYYESGREAYSAPLPVKVLSPFDVNVAATAQAQKSGARPVAPPMHP
jgi:hypothetical protein